MEMGVVVPVAPVDFNFDSSSSSPYMTAPSSPQRFGNFYFSAPTSPTRASAFYHELNSLSLHDVIPRSSASSIPFNWEERPGIPKSKAINNGESDNDNDGGEDFEFDFSGHLERTSLSADELFDGGKIKPLKPPPRLQVGTGANDHSVSISSPRSPRSRISQGKRMVQEALSPRHKKDFDPFAAAIEETRKKGELDQRQGREQEQKRGRGKFSVGSSSSSFLRRGTRSLSPLRVSDLVLGEEEYSPAPKINIPSTASNTKASSTPSSAYSSFLSSFSFSKGYRKWRLKDFLLFRSASEGRATGKDPLTKYAVLSKNKLAEDVKNSSFRSTDSSGSVSTSSRRRGPVSAHEMHYTVNRAASEEMRRKTFLPYKQGLLGCLGFNPGVHEVTKAFGSLTRG
ncbi:hypothetical protein F2P56_029195 [Juglans regia]|uniref:Uncharacterized protein n=2 Tax=Juglans regia TaxID=51240 RepID=A0A833WGQ0_JUGRE|nr:uncharacterized protein LOC109002347 [Juglans regia]KAF5448688.1 hypothetical protein F2P56_029195 [Juglans regia]